MTLLILGSSHAARLKRRLPVAVQSGHVGPDIAAEGVPGGRLGCPRHHHRLLAMAASRRPDTVVLMIGGNDLCARDFDLPSLSQDLISLALGLSALGVGRVYILPIIPRSRTRPGDVTPARFEERRAATNHIWETRFRRPPVTMINMEYPQGALRRDGVHLSRRGERAVLAAVHAVY